MPKQEGPDPATTKFMEGVVDAIQKLVGPEGKVAILGDENGVFCVMFTVMDLPSPLIMANCAAMITGMMHRGLAKTYMDEQTTEMSNKVH